MRGVFDYLAVAPARVQTRFVPTNPKPLWQKITNYKYFADRGLPQAAQLRLPLSGAHASLRKAA